ncbi:unnamed protein product [Leptosia nina]|uniref:G-protein coupled receptors family 1 profile domain-containing protein n=1 Tax=Leptosia nina TaxID=320188 RepID=A0AAV1ITI2_9NEOP
MSYEKNGTNATINESLSVDPTLIFGPQRDSMYIVVPITIIYSLIFITGLFGNIFTCIVIMRNKNMHTATNYYLFSLAISDLLLLVSGMPQEMYSIWYKWPYVFGQSFCVIRGLAAETSTNASILTITLFTIERYLAICHPFVSHKMSKLSRAIKHVILLWIISFGLALPQALQFGIRVHKGVTMCLQTRVIIEHSFELSTIFLFFAPMLVITVLYSLIGLRLNKSNVSKGLKDKGPPQNKKVIHKIQRKNSTQSTKRVVKMLVAVVVGFFICWAPFHAQRLVAIYGTAENHLAKSSLLLSAYYYLTYTSGVFYYVSTCINPIFYHIMSNKFREAFKATISQCCCRHADRPVTKRCSYTAVPFTRQPTSSGSMNSGSFKHQLSIKELKPIEYTGSKDIPTSRVFKVCEKSMTATMTETKQRTDLSKLSKSREADWPAVLFFIHIHLLSLYAIWLLFTEAKLLTILLLVVLTLFATLGATTGAHRLWAHSTYTASTELRIVLMLFQTLVGQGSIYDWVQNHRLHHAHFKTDGDPYDHRQGFIYAHFLTRLRKLSEYQTALKESIDMSDLEKDSVVMFQKRFYWVLYGVLFILLPLNAPLEYWDDSIMSSIFVIGFLRYCLVLHASWLIESGVALWGLKEGEKYPPDSNVVFLLNRTFWPHYHYIYPQDYKSGEYGSYGSGCSTAFIKIYAATGLATHLSTLEPRTLQVAMATAAKSKRPIPECIREALQNQVLRKDHYLN